MEIWTWIIIILVFILSLKYIIMVIVFLIFSIWYLINKNSLSKYMVKRSNLNIKFYEKLIKTYKKEMKNTLFIEKYQNKILKAKVKIQENRDLIKRIKKWQK